MCQTLKIPAYLKHTAERGRDREEDCSSTDGVRECVKVCVTLCVTVYESPPAALTGAGLNPISFSMEERRHLLGTPGCWTQLPANLHQTIQHTFKIRAM